MNIKRPLILISNDDGYHAKGINQLIDMLRDLADIVVCAPESARSGFATAFSATGRSLALPMTTATLPSPAPSFRRKRRSRP